MGLQLTNTPSAVTVTVLLAVIGATDPGNVAVTVTVWVAFTVFVVPVKLTLELPAGIVALKGTITAVVSLLLKLTGNGWFGASFEESVKVKF